MDLMTALKDIFGGYTALYAVWAWFVLIFFLVSAVVHLFVSRWKNDHSQHSMKKIFPIFDSLAEEIKSGWVDVGRIKQTVFRARYGLFALYIENNSNLSDREHDLESLRVIARESGFADHLRRRAVSGCRWKRALAIRCLAYLKDNDNVDVFRRVLEKDRFQYSVYSASLGLAACGDVSSLAKILKALYIDKPSNRDMILAVVSWFDSVAVDPLTKMLESEDIPSLLQSTLADFLGTLKYAPAGGVIARLLNDSTDTEAKIHFVEALEKIGSRENCALIESCLSDADFRLRLKAINALERIGGVEFLAKAEEVMGDENHWVRRNAAEAMSRMGERGIARLKEMALSQDAARRRSSKMVLADLEFKRMRWRYRYADSIP